MRHVAGDANAPRASYEGTPVKTAEIALGPSHKIEQGDWPWHATAATPTRRAEGLAIRSEAEPGLALVVRAIVSPVRT